MPAPVGAVSWVQLRVSVECRACRQQSPVSFLGDGAFRCAVCGQDGTFDAAWWYATVLPLASAAADAFWANAGVYPPWPTSGPDDCEGPGPLSVNDVVIMMSAVGRTRTGPTVDDRGSSRRAGSHFHAAPGHPLCPR
ncbi:MAG: hypothetical protein ACRELB_04425, partial [Polyangiaceae bacterium]